MLIGIPKEIKDQEYRVGMLPGTVRELVHHGHQVIVETQAAADIGIDDMAYESAGAVIVKDAEVLFKQAELIVKVKEPQPIECKRLQRGQTLFTYLHLAPDPEQTELLLGSGCTAIAYETVVDLHGKLPLLMPMSEVAGRLSIQAGAHCLEKAQGGSGVLLGGVPGTSPANIVVLGGGVVGTQAVKMAIGAQARVTVIDQSLDRLRELNFQFDSNLNTIFSTKDAIEKYVSNADLVIGAVLISGSLAPKLITHDLIRKMRPGSVLVDVAIDQGGCFETSKPTTHTHPTYILDGVTHYCVANMPSAVARTSTSALNNATLPFIVALANKGIKTALQEDPCLLQGLNLHAGKITYPAVAEAMNRTYVPALQALA